MFVKATADTSSRPRRQRPLAVALGSLIAFMAFGVTAAEPPPSAPEPVNLNARVLLLRLKPAGAVRTADLATCESLEDILRVTRAAGTVSVIVQASREVVCHPAAQIRMDAIESRSVFVPGAAAPTNQEFGLRLKLDLRTFNAPNSQEPVAAAVVWNGDWSGSVQLLSRWEALAVRGFNLAARSVPGITYERVEEDEDGFVNTGGGANIGGLFRRKKKEPAPKPAKNAAKPAAGAAPVPAPAAAPGENEPSYQAGTDRQRIQLEGAVLTGSGRPLLSRHPLAERQDGELLFILIPTWSRAQP